MRRDSEYGTRVTRGFVAAALLFLAICCASSPPDTSEARARAEPGPYRVEEGGEVVLPDFTRAKVLSVTVTFPAGEGPFPVIVFSHGAGASGSYPYPLTRFWTSWGYVVLHPSHADSLAFDRRRIQELFERSAGIGLTDSVGWENRARDLSFVLDSLPELEEKMPSLRGKLDARKIGVAGHSYGAHTAQLIGGARVDFGAGAGLRSFEDPRPLAFLLLSGPGSGARGLTGDSWNGWTRPMMAVTGSRDFARGGRPPAWHLDPFQRAPAGDKYALSIEGAAHLSFTGRLAEDDEAIRTLARLRAREQKRESNEEAASPREEREIFRWVRAATLAFWDAYLKNDPGAKAFLQPDVIAGESRGRARLSRK